MAKFSKENQPAPSPNRGRPVGSRNKRGQFSNELSTDAILKLTDAVAANEQWAIIEVLKRISPSLKPITPTDSLDADYLRAKIFELSEMEQRLKNLEELGVTRAW